MRADPAQVAKADPDPGSAFAVPAPALILIRHGETEWSRTGQHTGRTDIELTEAGRRQARAAGTIVSKLLGGQTPAAVISSPLRRATLTAELAGFAVTETSPDAAEWDYGSYEGLTTPQIREADPNWNIWDGIVPDGETAEMMRVRIDRLLSQVRQAVGRGPVLVFSHGHASRCLAARWLGESVAAGRKYRLGTGAVCGLDYEHGYPVILHWNLDETVLSASW